MHKAETKKQKDPKPEMVQTQDKLSLVEQKELKDFVDQEISSKMKTVVKNKMVKLFQQYAMNKDQQEMKEEAV